MCYLIRKTQRTRKLAHSVALLQMTRLSGQVSADSGKLTIGSTTDRSYGSQTNDDDQCQHHRVLHGCGAIFRSQESLHTIGIFFMDVLRRLNSYGDKVWLACDPKTDFGAL